MTTGSSITTTLVEEISVFRNLKSIRVVYLMVLRSPLRKGKLVATAAIFASNFEPDQTGERKFGSFWLHASDNRFLDKYDCGKKRWSCAILEQCGTYQMVRDY